ncbi:o-succinylbenzoate--CoA ligase [Ewingella americana]|jgi:O-succinylbenzoic acid--CoA ligase|uniref:O-succinylbenzoate--CoA ligase n=1 Tax=Ewingella americana TaxID=41202 RepID=A0A502GUQ8_9GAMM|nr:o-succinylbenzoate--CoA ligase [Ewingella americana]TPG65202.1 o-succinylbenzoate--CoA ligase [Ewingella americana]
MAGMNNWPWRVWAERTPFAVALKSRGTAWCWRDLLQRIDSLAAGFIQQGVSEGAGVVLRSKNSPDALLAYLALLQTGARLLPLNPQLPASLCAELLPSLDIRFILDLSDSPPELAPYALELRHAGSGTTTAAWHPERLATLTLTSGSSGLPKAAAHSAQAHLASAAGVLGLLPFSPGDSWLLSLPLFHVSGQGIIWRWLSAGATLRVLADGESLDAALDNCSHASLVPTQLWRLLQQPQRPEKLQDVLLGGAHIPQELTEQAERAGIRCWCGYGMTETASTVTAKRADGSRGVGHALAGKEVMLQNDEVLIRTPSLAAGYWKSGALTPLTDAEGWFHTRDRGEWQGDELHIAGRLDNLFFSAGEGIQPEDIERVLQSHPQVDRAFVLPVKDDEFGQRPVALVDAHPGATFEHLAEWLQDKLARFQLPVRYYALPQEVAQGGIKISRQQLKLWLEKQPV